LLQINSGVGRRGGAAGARNSRPWLRTPLETISGARGEPLSQLLVDEFTARQQHCACRYSGTNTTLWKFQEYEFNPLPRGDPVRQQKKIF